MRNYLREKVRQHRSSLHLLVRVASGSLLLMLIKIGLVEGILYLTESQVWLVYGAVTLVMTFVGWTYHSFVSFRKPLSRKTLVRHFQQAAIFKLADYGIVNGVVYGFGAPPSLVIIGTSGIIFVLRTLVFARYVFKDETGPEEETQ